MTDGDASTGGIAAREPVASSTPASLQQSSLVQLLRAQSLVPRRSQLGRLFGRSPLAPTTETLYRGVVGELEVGESLDRLGPRWRILHTRPVDDDSPAIDHLVIGPSGVFCVVTRTHTGLDVWASQRTLMVDGMRHPHLRDIEHEMGRTEAVLSTEIGRSVEVSGILAMVAMKSLVVQEAQRDVALLPSRTIVSWLLRRKSILSNAEVIAVAAAATACNRWSSPDDSVSAVHERGRAEFEILRGEVRTARRIQLAWAISVTVLVVGAFAAITYGMLVSTVGIIGV